MLVNIYVSSINGAASSIQRPAVQANTFEIKSVVIQMIQSSVQFGGLPNGYPNTYMFKYNGVTEDAIRLRLFPFSLRDKVKYMLNSLPARSITNWDAMALSFLAKYFSLKKPSS